MRLAAIATQLIDFCYPRFCVACGIAINDDLFCETCGIELSKLEASPFCDRCGMPLAQPDAPCAHCLGKGVPHFERIVRLGTFSDPLKHLIHQMKYHRRWTTAELLAARLIRQEPAKALLSETDVLVAVPLHPLRQISRGYNQADVIARAIGRACRIPVAAPIVRVRRTPMQTAMPSPTKRQENMRDAFALSSGRKVRGKHVVLIDDVMTTGATLQSAARVLQAAKPASISALVIAVADPKHRDFQSI